MSVKVRRFQTYTRKDGTIAYVVDVRNAEGRKIRRAFDRVRDADDFYQKMRQDRLRVTVGLDPLIEDIRLRDFVDQWLTRRKAEGQPLSSWQAYESRVRLFIKPAFGYVVMSRIQTYQVEKFLSELMPKYGISASTRNKVREIFHTIFRDAIALRHALKNPVSGTRKLKVAEDKWAIWNSGEDVEKYLAAAQLDCAPWFYPLVYLMLHTGIRLGEALALKWDEDVNCEEGWAHIHQTLEKETMTVVERTKGKRARWVGLNEPTIAVLKIFRESRPKLLALRGAQVFTWDDGHMVHPRRAIKVQYRVCERAGVARIRLHDLRHQYASMFTQSKGNRYALQKLLGHSSAGMVDRYSHLDPKYLREQANVVQFTTPSGKNHASYVAQNRSNGKSVKSVKRTKNNAL